MKKFVLILYIFFFINIPAIKAQEIVYNDEFLQLKNLNTELKIQLSSATDKINKIQSENHRLKGFFEVELEKTRKELENKSCEVRMLRQKLMISADDDFTKIKTVENDNLRPQHKPKIF